MYNPFGFDLHEDPYVVYGRLRDEAPAYWNPDLEFWALSRFEDVLDGFRDLETYSSSNGVALESRGQTGGQFRQMIEMDPPEHTSFRKLVSRVFTGRRIADMEDQIRGVVSGYLDTIAPVGEADLVAEVSGPFPMEVISLILGIPPSDRPELRRYADQLMIRDDGRMEMPAEALEGMLGLVQYFADDLRTRRADQRDGLISDLLDLEVDGRSLTEKELLGFCVLFVVAGHETTTKLLANAVELLAEHPEQRALLVGDPTLVPDAVEETLRFNNSTQYMHRTLTHDVELHGETLEAGQSVLLVIGAGESRRARVRADRRGVRHPAPRRASPGVRVRRPLLPRCGTGPDGEQGRARGDPPAAPRVPRRPRPGGALPQRQRRRVEDPPHRVHADGLTSGRPVAGVAVRSSRFSRSAGRASS